ncbi:MAG: hypothetical protein NVS1B1_03380 [Candidatus Limnocylindrales bacterium]
MNVELPGSSRTATLGERVRAARREAGLTQGQVAGAELTKGFISQVEAGQVRPSIRSLQLIAGRLGRPLEYFLGDEPLADSKRSAFHRLAAEAALERAEWPEASAHASQALDLAVRRTDQAVATRLLAAAALGAGRIEDAFDRITAALELLDQAPDAAETCRLLYLRGSAYVQARQLVAACEAFEGARDLVERSEITDPRLRARISVALGTCYRRLGRPTKALEAYHQGQAIASRSSELRLAAQGLMGAAVSHYDAGELDGAVTSYERALELFERIADSRFELSVLQSLAAVHVELGELDEAQALAGGVRSRAEIMGASDRLPIADTIRARVSLARGQAAAALALATTAERALAAAGDHRQQADALRVIGAASGVLGHAADADRAYRRSIELLGELGDRVDLATVATEYSKLLRARGEIDAAFEMLELASARGVSGR